MIYVISASKKELNNNNNKIISAKRKINSVLRASQQQGGDYSTHQRYINMDMIREMYKYKKTVTTDGEKK